MREHARVCNHPETFLFGNNRYYRLVFYTLQLCQQSCGFFYDFHRTVKRSIMFTITRVHIIRAGERGSNGRANRSIFVRFTCTYAEDEDVNRKDNNSNRTA